MNLPKGLYLRIDHEVEIKCGCDGGGWKDEGDNKSSICTKCMGTGRITKRIRGWCEHSIVAYVKDTRPKSVEIILSTYLGGGVRLDPAGGTRHVSWIAKGLRIGKVEMAVAKERFTDKIIAALLDGSLPDEIAVNIKMED